MTKSSENFISVKIGCSKTFYSYRFEEDSLGKLSTTITFCPSLDANGLEDEQFKNKLAHPHKHFQRDTPLMNN